MDFIIGLGVLFLVYLAFTNFWAFVGVGAIVAVIWMVVNACKMDSNQRKNTNNTAASPKPASDKCRAGYCKFYNLSKAKGAGYDESYCYCEKNAEFVKLKNDCSDYKRSGCAVSFCDHADFSAGKKAGRGGNVCYCRYYNEYREAQQSCPGYTSEVTGAMIRDLLGKK